MSFGFGIGDVLVVLELANKVRRNWIDAPPEYAAIYNSTRDLSNILRDITDLSDRVDLTLEQAADLRSAVSSCTAVLESLDVIIDRYSALKADTSSPHRRVRRLWKRLKLDPDDIRDVRSQLTSSLVSLNAVHSRLVGEWTYDIREDVKSIVQSEAGRKNLEIADWLASTEHAEQQSDYLAQRSHGTCTWFLNHPKFQGWCQNDGATIVCPGMPGSGKTILLATVIKHLQDLCANKHDTAVIYFYYNYRRPSEHGSSHILASFVRQLLQQLQQKQVPQCISTFYEKDGIRGCRPTNEDLKDFFRALASTFRKTYVIIDALDEANTSGNFQPGLLEYISKLQSEGIKINLLASTRERPDILEHFDLEEKLEIQAHHDDINTYLEGRMTELMSGVARNVKLQAEIKTRVTMLADGMFLLARLHFDALCNETTPRAVQKALHNMSQGSEALLLAYESARERINHQSKGRRELAHQVLMWISCGLGELTIRQLQHAIAVEPDMDDIDDDYHLVDDCDLLSVCAGLVVVDVESSTIRLVHLTLQEYLDHVRDDWFPNADTFLATKCVDYLLLNVFSQSHQKFGGCEVSHMTQILQDHDLYGYSFIKHAVKYWGFYATRSKDKRIVKELSLALYGKPIHFHGFCQLLVCSSFSVEQMTYRENVTLLHVAAYFGFTEFAEELLISGHNPRARDSCDMTPLMWAAEYGQKRTFDLFLDRSDVDLNCETDYRGVTVLILAARSGHNEIVKSLLQRPDVEPNVQSHYDGTAIAEAVSHGHANVVETLLPHLTIYPHTNDGQEWSLIQRAAWYGNVDVLKLLLNHTTWSADEWSTKRDPPLHLAAHVGNIHVLQLLLKLPDVDINVPDIDGRTALSIAAQWDDGTAVEFLISQPQISLNTRDRFGMTPLMTAIRGTPTPKYTNIVLLASHPEVDLNCRDRNGHSALAHAIISTPILSLVEDLECDVVKFLLARPDIEVNSRDNNGYTPLHLAVQQNFCRKGCLLLQHSDIDLAAISQDGHTAFTLTLEQHRESKASRDRSPSSIIMTHHRLETVKIISSKEPEFLLHFNKDDFVEYSLRVQDVWKALEKRWGVDARHLRLSYRGIDLAIGWSSLDHLYMKDGEDIHVEIASTARTFEYTAAEIAEKDKEFWDYNWEALKKALTRKMKEDELEIGTRKLAVS